MSLSPKNHQPDLENATTTEQVAEAPAAAGEEDQGELSRQLEEKTQEARENYERMLRLAAELENLKKRQEKERTDLVMYANESILKELLPVVDSLELALSHGRQQENAPALLEGIENVLKGFQAALAKFGVSPLHALGEKFDPAFHNAVMQQESSEAEDQTIIQELQKGYLLNNRLLRPTMVVVARNPSTESVRINVKV
jgi:molecular chaperone GrpE